MGDAIKERHLLRGDSKKLQAVSEWRGVLWLLIFFRGGQRFCYGGDMLARGSDFEGRHERYWVGRSLRFGEEICWLEGGSNSKIGKERVAGSLKEKENLWLPWILCSSPLEYNFFLFSWILSMNCLTQRLVLWSIFGCYLLHFLWNDSRVTQLCF